MEIMIFLQTQPVVPGGWSYIHKSIGTVHFQNYFGLNGVQLWSASVENLHR